MFPNVCVGVGEQFVMVTGEAKDSTSLSLFLLYL